MSLGSRVAVVGGDARQKQRWRGNKRAVFYMAPRDGGNGELKRLEAALRSGTIGRVVILARWNGHGATKRIRRISRALGIAVEIVP